MRGTSFVGQFVADSLQVDGSLLMYSDGQNKATFKDVVLRNAKIKSVVAMNGATFDGKLDADKLQVGGDLYMRSDAQNKASFKDVVLRSAKVDDDVDMTGASFDGTLDADSLHVGVNLHMPSDGENTASFKDVVLRSAKITGQIDMTGASFDGKLDADSLQVGGDLFMYDTNCADVVNMIFAQIGGGLDLRGATLAGLDLSGASVTGDLRLGEPGKPGKPVHWKGKNGEPGLTLRNAHVSNLMDAEDAWPDRGHLHLDGFSFNHLGGFEGETEPEMRERGMDW